MLKPVLATIAFTLANGLAHAGPEDFHDGILIPDYGQIAAVPEAMAIPEGAEFKIAFDIAKAAEPGEINRRIASSARLLNMHAEAGLPPEATSIAIIIHGGAHKDLTIDTAYGGENANAGLIAALIDAGVRIELCGQTAAYYGITKADLLPGVELSLSAMTSHALLQNEGYTLNPF
jgi:intracellular sulfur oxidation DsrE/DsrF family protein